MIVSCICVLCESVAYFWVISVCCFDNSGVGKMLCKDTACACDLPHFLFFFGKRSIGVGEMQIVCLLIVSLPEI